MKRFVLFLGLLLIPALLFVVVPNVLCQVPFNDENTSHPYDGDPDNYWCFDCHYFEYTPLGEKWVKQEIQALDFHTAFYPSPGTISVSYLSGTSPPLVTLTCPTDCGPCQACHTETYMNDEFGNPDLTKPVWQNADRGYGLGMDHGGADYGTNCLECHWHWNDDGRYMFFPAGAGTGPSHDLHLREPIKGPKILVSSGPPVLRALDCPDCHGDSYADPIVFKDGQQLAGTTVCEDCHSRLGFFNGVDDLDIGAKPNWVNGGEGDSKIYNLSGTGLNFGRKDWCLGCHDRHEGTSQIAGAYAPPVAGDNFKYGYKKSGHGRPDIDGGMDCEDCHDLGITHIDGYQRTYVASANNHKTGYRLTIGSAVPRGSDDNYDPDNLANNAYAGCVNPNCHDWDSLTSDPAVGGGIPISGFRSAYQELNPCGQVKNFHWEHLDPDHEWLCGDSDYNGVVDSRQTCILCHNVHGSRMVDDASNPTVVVANPVMIRDGFLISDPGPAENKVPAFDFKWYRGTVCSDPPGPLTDSYLLSRWGAMECGDQSGSLAENKVCFGCHPTTSPPLGSPIQYFREPTLTIKRVWIADPSTDAEVTSVPVGGTVPSVRYKVEFVVAGPPSTPYVRTHPSLTKAENAPGFTPAWATPFSGAGYVSIGTHVWAAESPLPTAWDLTIPGTASSGTDAARVMIPLGMFHQSGGTLLNWDYGPGPGTGNPSPLPSDYDYFDLN